MAKTSWRYEILSTDGTIENIADRFGTTVEAIREESRAVSDCTGALDEISAFAARCVTGAIVSIPAAADEYPWAVVPAKEAMLGDVIEGLNKDPLRQHVQPSRPAKGITAAYVWFHGHNIDVRASYLKQLDNDASRRSADQTPDAIPLTADLPIQVPMPDPVKGSAIYAAPAVCDKIVSSGGAAKTTVVIGPCRNRAYYRRLALEEAFGAATAKDIESGKAWVPSKGWDFNAAIVKKVYEYYGKLYSQKKDKFIWSALAHLGGGPFYSGFLNLEFARAHHASLAAGAMAMSGAAAPLAATDLVLKRQITEMCRYALEVLLGMGKAIFEHQAWQHVAYREGGLNEMLRFVDNGQLDFAWKPGDTEVTQGAIEAGNAWRNIDSSDEDRIWEGNRRLLQFEQQDVIAGGYAKLETIFLFPTATSFIADSPHPWGSTFNDYWLLHGCPNPKKYDVANYDMRWGWMSNDIMNTFRKHSSQIEDVASQSVDHLVTMSYVRLGERFVVPLILPPPLADGAHKLRVLVQY